MYIYFKEIYHRIEFEEEIEDGKTIATICNITELSNHYK
jgi:toxin HigB-1